MVVDEAYDTSQLVAKIQVNQDRRAVTLKKPNKPNSMLKSLASALFPAKLRRAASQQVLKDVSRVEVEVPNRNAEEANIISAHTPTAAPPMLLIHLSTVEPIPEKPSVCGREEVDRLKPICWPGQSSLKERASTDHLAPAAPQTTAKKVRFCSSMPLLAPSPDVSSSGSSTVSSASTTIVEEEDFSEFLMSKAPIMTTVYLTHSSSAYDRSPIKVDKYHNQSLNLPPRSQSEIFKDEHWCEAFQEEFSTEPQEVSPSSSLSSEHLDWPLTQSIPTFLHPFPECDN